MRRTEGSDQKNKLIIVISIVENITNDISHDQNFFLKFDPNLETPEFPWVFRSHDETSLVVNIMKKMYRVEIL